MSRTVLFVHTTQGDRMTGAPRLLCTLLPGLRQGPITPVFATQRESELTASLAAEGVSVRILPLPRGLEVFGGRLARPSPLAFVRALAGSFGYDRAFAALLADVNPNVVWATNLRTLLPIAAPCRRARIPLVWNVWLGQPSRGFVKLLNGVAIGSAARIFTEYGKQAAEIFTPSQLARAQPKIRTVFTGVAAPPVPPARRRGPSDPYVVGMLGAVSPRKDQRTFLEVASRVVREVPSARFLVGGDAVTEEHAAYRDELKRFAEEQGLSAHVEWCGWIDDPWSFLARLDVYLHTARAEGLPGAVRESLATALPVVATDVGGTHEEVVDGVTGLLAPAGDVDILASAVARLARQPSIARALGEAGRRRFEEHFSAEAFVASEQAALMELMERRSTPRPPRPLPPLEPAIRRLPRPAGDRESVPHRTS
jgi:glycosyltransferase involved in cell wall biosynthesis